MSCGDFETWIALYVADDLSAAERGRVESHLQTCSNCWDLAEDLKDSQAVFKSIAQDVPDATALSALRERVLNEVSGLETMTWFERFLFGGVRRKAALAGLALAVVGSGALWLARTPRPASQAPAAIAVNLAPAVVLPSSGSETKPLPAPPRPMPTRVRPRVPEPVPAPTSEEPKKVAIKFVTDDPNIIIYWLVDEKGD